MGRSVREKTGLYNVTIFCVVCSDDFKWTFASNSKNLFFAYAPIEVNLEVLADLHSTALKRLIPGR